MFYVVRFLFIVLMLTGSVFASDKEPRYANIYSHFNSNIYSEHIGNSELDTELRQALEKYQQKQSQSNKDKIVSLIKSILKDESATLLQLRWANDAASLCHEYSLSDSVYQRLTQIRESKSKKLIGLLKKAANAKKAGEIKKAVEYYRQIRNEPNGIPELDYLSNLSELYLYENGYEVSKDTRKSNKRTPPFGFSRRYLYNNPSHMLYSTWVGYERKNRYGENNKFPSFAPLGGGSNAIERCFYGAFDHLRLVGITDYTKGDYHMKKLDETVLIKQCDAALKGKLGSLDKSFALILIAGIKEKDGRYNEAEKLYAQLQKEGGFLSSYGKSMALRCKNKHLSNASIQIRKDAEVFVNGNNVRLATGLGLGKLIDQLGTPEEIHVNRGWYTIYGWNLAKKDSPSIFIGGRPDLNKVIDWMAVWYENGRPIKRLVSRESKEQRDWLISIHKDMIKSSKESKGVYPKGLMCTVKSFSYPKRDIIEEKNRQADNILVIIENRSTETIKFGEDIDRQVEVVIESPDGKKYSINAKSDFLEPLNELQPLKSANFKAAFFDWARKDNKADIPLGRYKFYAKFRNARSKARITTVFKKHYTYQSPNSTDEVYIVTPNCITNDLLRQMDRIFSKPFKCDVGDTVIMGEEGVHCDTPSGDLGIMMIPKKFKLSDYAAVEVRKKTDKDLPTGE